MRFAPEYITYVLNENFEDAKRLFVAPLMAPRPQNTSTILFS